MLYVGPVCVMTGGVGVRDVSVGNGSVGVGVYGRVDVCGILYKVAHYCMWMVKSIWVYSGLGRLQLKANNFINMRSCTAFMLARPIIHGI